MRVLVPEAWFLSVHGSLRWKRVILFSCSHIPGPSHEVSKLPFVDMKLDVDQSSRTFYGWGAPGVPFVLTVLKALSHGMCWLQSLQCFLSRWASHFLPNLRLDSWELIKTSKQIPVQLQLPPQGKSQARKCTCAAGMLTLRGRLVVVRIQQQCEFHFSLCYVWVGWTISGLSAMSKVSQRMCLDSNWDSCQVPHWDKTPEMIVNC